MLKRKSVECWKCKGTGDWLRDGDSDCISCGGSGVLSLRRLISLRDDYWPERLATGKCSQRKYDVQMELINAAIAQLSVDERRSDSDDDGDWDMVHNAIIDLETHCSDVRRTNRGILLPILHQLQSALPAMYKHDA